MGREDLEAEEGGVTDHGYWVISRTMGRLKEPLGAGFRFFLRWDVCTYIRT